MSRRNGPHMWPCPKARSSPIGSQAPDSCVTWCVRSSARWSRSAPAGWRWRTSLRCWRVVREMLPVRPPRQPASAWSASTTAGAARRLRLIVNTLYNHGLFVTAPMSLDQLVSWLPPDSPDATLARQLNPEQLPVHVAVIMDGNGRWAAQRHLPRVEGHRAGITGVREIVEASARLGIGALTLYVFSVENWKRPRAEVATLMMLLKRYLRLELGTLIDNNLRFLVVGRLDDLEAELRNELGAAMRRTADNTGMRLNVALNYGGRAEIVDAARRAIREGVPADDLDEARFSDLLYTAGQPDPDLLIRTSGEVRVSNFLLWQIAYAEIYVTETFWPDFRTRHLLEAILAYQKRDRRYGGIKPSRVAIGK